MQHFIFAWLPHGTDFLWIFLGAVLLFGADKIPKLARGLGKSLGEFKKAKDEFDKEVQSAANAPDAKKTETPALTPGTPTTTVSSAQPVNPTDALTKKI